MMETVGRYWFQDPWFACVPAIHDVLAGDVEAASRVALPPPPTHGYWFGAYYVGAVILGWDDVGAGLAALPSAFDESDGAEPAARLVALFDHDARLAAVAGWAWRTWNGEPRARPRRAIERLERFGTAADVSAAMHQYGFGSGDPGADDPHHLRAHAARILSAMRGDAPAVSFDLVRSEEPRRVAIVVHGFEDWPAALGSVSRTLPAGQPSWHAHVTSRRDGWLGTFRRCWECGRWFQGRAAFHRLGHAS